jgi:hypothetical protein
MMVFDKDMLLLLPVMFFTGAPLALVPRLANAGTRRIRTVLLFRQFPEAYHTHQGCWARDDIVWCGGGDMYGVHLASIF